MTRIVACIYGLYAWTLLVIVVLLTTISLLLVPGLKRRRQIASFGARLVFRFAGIKLKVSGAPFDESRSSVVVANHASYLDGIILTAVLPANFSFLVKREMDSVPIAGLLLRRLGTEFIERFDSRRGVTDTRRLLRTAATGQGLAAFPEGTFRAEPGLGLFHSGAFTAAVRGRMPVVPLTLLGSREILPAHKHLPIPGQLHVIFHPAISPGDPENGRNEVIRIRDESRAAILSALDEPGLDFRLPTVLPSRRG